MEGNRGRPICPVEGTNLERVVFQGIEVDVCRECGGIWFDRGELDDVMREALATPQSVAGWIPRPGPPQSRPRTASCCARGAGLR
jgi:Zn-finger nucleic acid-binding protein